MEVYPHAAGLLPRNSGYRIADQRYFLPVQHSNVQVSGTNMSQPLQNVPVVSAPANVSRMMGTVPVASQLQFGLDGNPTTVKGFIINNNCYPQQSVMNTQESAGVRSNYVDVHAVHIAPQNEPPLQGEQLNVNLGRTDQSEKNLCQNTKSSYNSMKRMVKIPELTQVKINTDLRENIGGLKIQVSGNFLSWNVAGRTILDLNFMRNLFYITKIDIVLKPDFSYDKGVCHGLKKLVQNNLFSDWLVLKCEEKQMPFFKVNDQVQMYSVNNFITLLSLIAQESCLPLPYITRHGKNMKYFYLNFPKSCNNRVRKLNIPIFHDADNGRKKVPCKYPGIRLDCSFETAIHQFVFHVKKSAVPAFRQCVSYLRQILIYNHVVWGFLQAWIRKVREQYNGCFRVQEIAQNLSLCQGETARVGRTSPNELELIYCLDYLDFYLKFDPVSLADTSVSFTLENFETNFVSDVSLVQYYRQFFLINDMHYSDALTNLILFSGENGANDVTEFTYMTVQNNVSRSNEGFPLPGGLNKSPTQQSVSNACREAPGSDVEVNVQVEYQSQVERRDVPANKCDQPPRRNSPKASDFISKPLIKTRTVEEINSAIDMKNSSTSVQPNFDFILTEEMLSAGGNSPSIPASVQDMLNRCYGRNMQNICNQDMSRDCDLQQVFNDALQEAMEMRSVEGFIEKLYVTLQRFFTNHTCQIIMNRTILKALEIRFPTLRTLLYQQNPDGQGSPLLAALSANQTVQEIQNDVSLKPAETVSETVGNNVTRVMSVVTNTQSASMPQPMVLEPSLHENIPPSPPPVNQQESASVTEQNRIISPAASPLTHLKPSFTENLTPNKTNMMENEEQEESIDTMEGVDRNAVEKQVQETDERVNTKNNTENVSEASVVVVETKDNISINLTLPLSKSVENSFIDERSLGRVEEVESEQSVRAEQPKSQQQLLPEEQEQQLLPEEQEQRVKTEISPAPEKIFYNLKPCSVVLNVDDVIKYQIKKKRERLRKRWRNDVQSPWIFFECDFEDDNDSYQSDSSDSDFVPEVERKKRRKVSEFQFLETKTRVRQRFRNKRGMRGVGVRKAHVEKELQFHRDRPQASRRWRGPYEDDSEERKKEEDEDEASNTEDSKYQALYNECLTRQAKVVLVRLEKTTGYQAQNSKWKVHTYGDGRLTLTRDYSAEYDKLPKNKRKYFELKEGKLYLKKQYAVKNGRIVPVAGEGEHGTISPKEEPPSTENESDFPSIFIKQENEA